MDDKKKTLVIGACILAIVAAVAFIGFGMQGSGTGSYYNPNVTLKKPSEAPPGTFSKLSDGAGRPAGLPKSIGP